MSKDAMCVWAHECPRLLGDPKFIMQTAAELTASGPTESESESEVAQSCPILCDRMDCSLPGSSDHGIFQAIVLEWIAISFSRGSSQSRDRTQVSRIIDRRFTVWATREVQQNYI